MSFASEKKVFGKEKISIVEFDLDYCSLSYSVAPCKAGRRTITLTSVLFDDFNVGDTIEGGTSGANGEIIDISGSSPTYTFTYRVSNGLDFSTVTEGITNLTETGVGIKNGSATILLGPTGDEKCYNTLKTCQDIPNFTKEIKTYRFYTQRSPAPIGISTGLDISAIPCLKNDPTITPSVTNVGGGLGVRANASAAFNDLPHSDIGIDKYVSERTYNASERGTFWTKLRARNPGYENRPMRTASGYLVNNIYESENFEVRHHILDKIDVGNGVASIKGKDPLKLAMVKKAKVPKISTGQINDAGGINSTDLSLTLKPSGVGSEYDASGFILIDNEVMSFTRASDVLTIVRAQYNTTAAAHSESATVQQCYQKNAQVNIIVEDWLTNFASIDPAFIPSSAWQSEIDNYLNGLLDGIIVKPMDLGKALVEISEASPHFLEWDSRTQLINLTALKGPPNNANTLNMDEHFIKDSFSVSDKNESRVSTVYVNYGQINPVKKLTEGGNFEKTHVRVDTDSLQLYDNVDQIRSISSRWITAANTSGARTLAALIGRRFSNTPRMINFTLDDKDSDVWIGQTRNVNHRQIVDFSGQPEDTLFQIISASEGDNYKYTGLEFAYGDEITGDASGGDPTTDIVIIDASEQNINLRARYNSLFSTPDGSTKAKFIVEAGAIIGSSSSSASIDTGSWPAGAVVTLQIDSTGFVVGKGGKGRHGTSTPVAEDGGLALILNYDLIIDNSGVIGGGGGGGGSATKATSRAAGGGGAGDNVGAAGAATTSSEQFIESITQAKAGDLETGGGGGRVTIFSIADPVGGTGGSLGAAGAAGTNILGGGSTFAGGAAGDAIDKNGFVLTEDLLGDVRGSIIA